MKTNITTASEFGKFVPGRPTVVLVSNGKGGAGKSPILKTIADRLKQAGLKPLIIDADDKPDRPGTLKRFFPEAETLVAPGDAKSSWLLDRIMEATEKHMVVLVDTPAGLTGILARWLEDSDVLGNLAHAGINFVVVVPYKNYRDAIYGVKAVWSCFGPEAQKRLIWVLIKNLCEGEPDAFMESGLHNEIMAAGAEEADFPAAELPEELKNYLDNHILDSGTPSERCMTYSTAIEVGNLSWSWRSRLTRLRDAQFAELDKLSFIKGLLASKPAA